MGKDIYDIINENEGSIIIVIDDNGNEVPIACLPEDWPSEFDEIFKDA